MPKRMRKYKRRGGRRLKRRYKRRYGVRSRRRGGRRIYASRRGYGIWTTASGAPADFGFLRGTNPARNRTSQENSTVAATRELNFWPLILLERGQQLDQRQRDTVYCSGIRLNVAVNINVGATKPIYFNMACISLRKRNEQSIDTLNFSKRLTFGDWFRREDGDTRSMDFQAATNIEMFTSAINADEYNVWWRHKLLLPVAAASSVFVNGDRSNYYHFKKWIPIKKTLRWDQGLVGVPTQQVWFVCWCSYFQEGTPLVSVANCVTTGVQAVVSFRQYDY